MLDSIDNLFGIYAIKLTIWHMIVRCLIVYILGILLTRFNKRFMAFRTVNNFYLFIFIGSILASSIIGNLFYETLGMAIFIIFVNWIVAMVGYYHPSFKAIIAGKTIEIISEGVINKKALNKFFISEEDLLGLLRAEKNSSNLKDVEKAYFESSGQISFVLKKGA